VEWDYAPSGLNMCNGKPFNVTANSGAWLWTRGWLGRRAQLFAVLGRVCYSVYCAAARQACVDSALRRSVQIIQLQVNVCVGFIR